MRPSDLLSGLFTGRSPAGALGVLGSLLGWLGEQMPGILVGIGVTFILTRLAGSQAGYLGRALWRVRWLVRGEALCPHCLGRGLLGEPILGDLGHNTCFTCLNEVTRGRVHAQGYVRLTTLMQGWDWVHWQQRVSYYTVPTPPREKRKAG